MSKRKDRSKLSESSVNITINDVPTELPHKFGKKVIEPFYKGGISEAIRDIMQKAIDEKKRSFFFGKFPWKTDESLLEEADPLIRRREYEDWVIFKFV